MGRSLVERESVPRWGWEVGTAEMEVPELGASTQGSKFTEECKTYLIAVRKCESES
jgi:hypothetical protein